MLVPIASLIALALVPQDNPAAARQPLSVLYAGEQGTPREAAWLEFLRSRFDSAESVSPDELLRSEARGFDVVIADGEVRMKDGRLEMSGCTRSHFPASWSRPTILIGSAGQAADRASRIGWL